MIYHLIGGERDGGTVDILDGVTRVDFSPNHEPCAIMRDMGIKPPDHYFPLITYTLREFLVHGYWYRFFALSTLTDSQVRIMASGKVMP